MPDALTKQQYLRLTELVGRELTNALVELKFGYADEARKEIAKFLSDDLAMAETLR
jgi:hypothetical protein